MPGQDVTNKDSGESPGRGGPIGWRRSSFPTTRLRFRNCPILWDFEVFVWIAGFKFGEYSVIDKEAEHSFAESILVPVLTEPA